MQYYNYDIIVEKEPIRITYLRGTLYALELLKEYQLPNYEIPEIEKKDITRQIANLLSRQLYYGQPPEVVNNILENISILNTKLHSEFLN